MLLLDWNAQTIPGEQDMVGQDGPQASGKAALLRQVRKITTAVLERGWPGESGSQGLVSVSADAVMSR